MYVYVCISMHVCSPKHAICCVIILPCQFYLAPPLSNWACYIYSCYTAVILGEVRLYLSISIIWWLKLEYDCCMHTYITVYPYCIYNTTEHAAGQQTADWVLYAPLPCDVKRLISHVGGPASAHLCRASPPQCNTPYTQQNCVDIIDWFGLRQFLSLHMSTYKRQSSLLASRVGHEDNTI